MVSLTLHTSHPLCDTHASYLVPSEDPNTLPIKDIPKPHTAVT